MILPICPKATEKDKESKITLKEKSEKRQKTLIKNTGLINFGSN